MGGLYANAAEFEALFSRMFDRTHTDDGMDELVEQQMVIRFCVRDPAVDMWIDGRSKPVQTSFGERQLDATLTAELTADTLHQLLMKTLPLAQAMLFRKLKVRGSKSKAMKLEGLLHSMQAAYPELIAGRRPAT